MPRQVRVVARHRILDDYFKVDQIEFEFEKTSGDLSEPITRLVLERGDSVSIVLHDQAADQILLCEQFRIATHEKGSGWMLELPAGFVDGEETPEYAARREVKEETGCEVSTLERVGAFYLSPGGIGERNFVFYANADLSAVAQTGGLATEGEDIRLLVVSFKEALAMIQDGRIVDAKTAIGIQWLALNRRAF